jgi:hypothetical protein
MGINALIELRQRDEQAGINPRSFERTPETPALAPHPQPLQIPPAVVFDNPPAPPVSPPQPLRIPPADWTEEQIERAARDQHTDDG